MIHDNEQMILNSDQCEILDFVLSFYRGLSEAGFFEPEDEAEELEQVDFENINAIVKELQTLSNKRKDELTRMGVVFEEDIYGARDPKNNVDYYY